jgi:hypothetical protein
LVLVFFQQEILKRLVPIFVPPLSEIANPVLGPILQNTTKKINSRIGSKNETQFLFNF